MATATRRYETRSKTPIEIHSDSDEEREYLRDFAPTLVPSFRPTGKTIINRKKIVLDLVTPENSSEEEEEGDDDEKEVESESADGLVVVVNNNEVDPSLSPRQAFNFADSEDDDDANAPAGHELESVYSSAPSSPRLLSQLPYHDHRSLSRSSAAAAHSLSLSSAHSARSLSSNVRRRLSLSELSQASRDFLRGDNNNSLSEAIDSQFSLTSTAPVVHRPTVPLFSQSIDFEPELFGHHQPPTINPTTSSSSDPTPSLFEQAIAKETQHLEITPVVPLPVKIDIQSFYPPPPPPLTELPFAPLQSLEQSLPSLPATDDPMDIQVPPMVVEPPAAAEPPAVEPEPEPVTKVARSNDENVQSEKPRGQVLDTDTKRKKARRDVLLTDALSEKFTPKAATRDRSSKKVTKRF